MVNTQDYREKECHEETNEDILRKSVFFRVIDSQLTVLLPSLQLLEFIHDATIMFRVIWQKLVRDGVGFPPGLDAQIAEEEVDVLLLCQLQISASFLSRPPTSSMCDM